ncbi:hypothetical protein VNO77_08979 [Canavalia gladiata]|uniref:Uncharacterized protein n=1 Tax=Canavalia gladiata TaxID=3824 RepID=A0AAN9MFH5_CANGL
MGAVLAIGFRHLSFEPDGHIAWFWAWRTSSEEKKYPGTSSGAVTRIGHFRACNSPCSRRYYTVDIPCVPGPEPCSLSISGGGRARFRLLHHQSRIAMPGNRLVAILLPPDEDWAPTHESAAPYFPSLGLPRFEFSRLPPPTSNAWHRLPFGLRYPLLPSS